MVGAQVPLQSVCQGEPLVFETSLHEDQGRIVSWQWDFGDPASGQANHSREENPTHVYQQPGSYRASLIISTARGIVDTLITPVEVHPLPPIQLDRIGTCQDTLVKLALREMAEGTQAFWCWGDQGAVDTGRVGIHRYAQPGHYPLHVRVESPAGCASELSDSLRWPLMPPSVHIPGDTICQGESVKFFKPPQAGRGTLRWYLPPDHGHPVARGDTLTTTPLDQTTQYSVARYDSLTGCESARTLVEATVFPPPHLRITHRYETPERIPARLAFEIHPSLPDLDYHWQFGDGKESRAATPQHWYQRPGSYMVSLQVTSPTGCRATRRSEVEIFDAPGIAYPSAFSPNGDGVNDYFSLEFANLVELEVQIYDRQGNLVFQSRQPDFRWEGHDFEGQALPAGVYVCAISGKDESGHTVKERGTLTLIR